MNDRSQFPFEQDKDWDDFQQIKGIGASMASALHASGIHHFEDLLTNSAEGLADILKDKVAFISAQRIERDHWLEQARSFARRSDESEVAEEYDSPVQEPETANSNHIPGSKKSSAGLDKGWRELADFIVSFGEALDSEGNARLMTRVHYSQGDEQEEWDGISRGQLLGWMLQKAGLHSASTESQDRELPGPVTMREVPQTTQELTWISFTYLNVEPVQEAVFTGTTAKRKTVRATSRLEITGVDAFNLAYDQVPFTVEVYLVDLQSKQTTLASASPGKLNPEQLIYEIQQDFPAPDAGNYQLYVVGSLKPPATLPAAYLQGPLLEVKG